ncbi:MAG: two-component system phosphate regulon sensor histidine kinase PhoR [Pseudomonadales bacterium]|jgi:two-component system phosphate regulon sensor histidine kinase PhoR
MILVFKNLQSITYFYKILLVVLLIMGVTFFIVNFYLEKFLLEKVKVIYKTINNFKRTKTILNSEVKDSDLLEEVNKDVHAWTQDKLGEIEELQIQENFRKEFIGNLSHELKTPLFTIQGYILTLLDGALDDPQHNELFLKKAAKSVDRMTALLEDLDSITAAEGAELPMLKEKFDIVNLTNEVFELLESAAASSKIELRLKSSNQKSEFVNADKEKITQVLTNLLLNSVKYGNKGGYTEVRFYDMDDTILIEIKDDGIGIEEEHLPRLFERFYRVDKSRSRHIAGTGLGLAITKHILEAHGHDISVRSAVGKGSTFAFSLTKA